MPGGLSTKIQEQGGYKLKFCLTKSDPFPRSNCGRDSCPLTRGDQECGERCYQAHCNYAILCTRCDPPGEVSLMMSTSPQHQPAPAHDAPHGAATAEQRDGGLAQHDDAMQLGDDAPRGGDAPACLRPPRCIYCGESSRGCKTRYEQHVNKYNARKGFMWEHTAQHHGGVQGDTPARDYYMMLCNVDRDPIRRVVRESIRIKTAREREDEGGGIGTVVMNDKSEWFGVRVVSVDFKQE